MKVGRFCLLTLAMILVIASCALARSTLQIMVHEGGDYLERTTQFFEDFGRRNPDINVEIVPGAGGTSPEEKLAVMVAAGIPPDLVRTWNAKQLGATGLLEDITPRFQGLPAAVRNDFWPDLIQDLSYQGRLYALPLGSVVTMYYYNRQHFDERGILPPSAAWSWEREGVAELKRLSIDINGDGALDRWGLGYLNQLAHVYMFIYAAGGGPLFTEDGKSFLGNTAVARDTLQFLQELAQVHQVMRTSGSWTEFAEQRVSSLLWGSFMAGYFPQYVNLDWDFALIPTFKGGRASNVWAETPYGIAVGARQADLAWRALEYISSVEGQQLSIKLGWAIPPARRSVAVGAFLQHFRGKDIDAIVQMLSAPNNQPLPRMAPSSATSALGNTVFWPVIQGQKAPGQALDEATSVIAAILQDR
jgi:ABC-type glycerol-3-phosphate transport system substrate-binding protein